MKKENISLVSKPPGKQAFTLVELIIVITILAILATIAFISFKNYAGNARDGNKLTTLSSIEKGLSLYQIKTGNYPTPDNIYGSGSYSGTLLNQVGFVGSGVVQSISMNTIPKDPIVDFEYTYGLSSNGKYYQLGTVLENHETTFIPQTYANNYSSKITGNYKGLYRFGVGSTSYIINLPSLIFTQSGAQNFGNISNDPKFVINNGGNLVKPYDGNNDENIDTVLGKLTGKTVSLTGTIVPTDWNSGSGTLAQELGYSEDEIGHEIYGENYYTDRNNLNGNNNSSSSSGGGGSICTNFTYSDWGTCQPNNTQTRTILTQSPNGCSGGSPDVLEQDCTYVPPIFENICTTSGQIIYTNALGGEIGRVDNTGTATSGNPGDITSSGHIVVCTGNQTGYVLRTINEGSTTVGTSSASYGNYYQWGNNWGGPAGSATSTIQATCGVNSTTSYPSFVTLNADWCSIQTDNIWGDIENNNIARKGPCPTDYHVPSISEWQEVRNAWGGGNVGANFSNTLKLPLADYRRGGGEMNNQNYGTYWTSSASFSTNAVYILFGPTLINSNSGSRALGLSVRCFKN